jgi:phage terminase large subunit-like protein
MIAMEMEIYNDEGEVIGKDPIYETWEKPVENLGDGTGQFLWPRQQRYDGRWFGFSREILAEKRGMYLDQRQFRAQYYNNPNFSSDEAISSNYFQYFDEKFLRRNEGRYFYKDKPLNIVAAVDFAYSTGARSDYTAIAVIGVDLDRNYYVLELRRFKTAKISEYYKAILDLHIKWGFRKIRAEATAAQQAIVEELKDSYIRPNGIALSIEVHKPTRADGTKEERMYNILAPRYENMSVWHYKGGMISLLEEELTSVRPAHDDLMDALAAAIEIASPPLNQRLTKRPRSNLNYHSRFGGVSI